jgi:hypothetical protein
MAALTIGALVLLVAQRLVGMVREAAAAADRTVLHNAREANGRRLLDRLAANAFVAGHDGPFRGGPRELEFTAWDETTDGRAAIRHLRLTWREGAVTLLGTARGDVTLWRDVADFEIGYLPAVGSYTRWFPQWLSTTSVPVALRLRFTIAGRLDSLVLYVGARG